MLAVGEIKKDQAIGLILELQVDHQDLSQGSKLEGYRFCGFEAI